MKHIVGYKIFESKQFSSRDITNKIYNYITDSYEDDKIDKYIAIEKEFGISCDELGEILQDFMDEYNLLYKCYCENKSIYIRFDTLERIDLRDHMRKKMIYTFQWNMNMDMLYEIDGRLSEYGLTIMNEDYFEISLYSLRIKKKI